MRTGCRLLVSIIFLPLCIGVSFMPLASAGGFSKDALGTTGGQFLELPVGARGVSMGAAQGAAAEDVSAIYYNPANLAGIQGMNATFMHAMYFQDISYDFAAFAMKTPNYGTFAFGLQYLSIGSLDKVDNSGNPTGDSLAPRDLAISIANARKFDELEYGVGVKYISSKLNSNANAYAADAGIRWSLEPAAFSLSILNLGSGLKFREETAPLPTTLRIGSSYKYVPDVPDQNWTFALDGILSKGAAAAVCAGVEYEMDIRNSFKAALRTGYNTRVGASGLGSQFSVDYAFTPFGELGNSHVISFMMKFGREEDPGIGLNGRSRGIRENGRNFKINSFVVVNAWKAKVYKSPDNTSAVIVEVLQKEGVKVLAQQGEWVQIKTRRNNIGWVRANTLRR